MYSDQETLHVGDRTYIDARLIPALTGAWGERASRHPRATPLCCCLLQRHPPRLHSLSHPDNGNVSYHSYPLELYLAVVTMDGNKSHTHPGPSRQSVIHQYNRFRMFASILLFCCLSYACFASLSSRKSGPVAWIGTEDEPSNTETDNAFGLNPDDKPWSGVRDQLNAFWILLTLWSRFHHNQSLSTTGATTGFSARAF